MANLIYSGIESPFGLLVYDEPPTLSEVISDLEWGSNSDIRKKGFRISRELALWKNVPRILDPQHIIQEDCFVGKNNGRSIWIVKIATRMGNHT